MAQKREKIVVSGAEMHAIDLVNYIAGNKGNFGKNKLLQYLKYKKDLKDKKRTDKNWFWREMEKPHRELGNY